MVWSPEGARQGKVTKVMISIVKAKIIAAAPLKTFLPKVFKNLFAGKPKKELRRYSGKCEEDYFMFP